LQIGNCKFEIGPKSERWGQKDEGDIVGDKVEGPGQSGGNGEVGDGVKGRDVEELGNQRISESVSQ